MKKKDLQAAKEKSAAFNTELNKNRKKELLDFCDRVHIHFKNLELLDLAFHHRSVTNEKRNFYNNERLEFLGDSVLGMVTAAYLYSSLENPEGDLAKIKSIVVSEKALAPVALKFAVDKLLVLGHGEEMTGGRKKPAILADCMEAIIGAYYLDSGYKNAEKYVLEFIKPAVQEVLVNGVKDYKSQLQEICQKKYKSCPVYELVEKSGPDHEQTFKFVVHIGDQTLGPASGKTKKEAEQSVAKQALDYLIGK